MSTHRLSFLIAVCLLLASTSLRAEGWSLTSWIPGQKEASKSSTTRKPLLGGKSLRSTTRSTSANQPSVWNRMTNGTKKMVARTKDALTWESEPEPRSRGQHSYWDDPAPRRSSKKKDDSSFWSWFKRDEPRPSKTVQDFLSQGRPEAQ